MENFLNQMRTQFNVAEESKSGPGGSMDSKIPIQKTQSFKGDKKHGGQNWFRKQFARKRSGDYDSREMDHAATVAAAAFAINLQDVSESETPEASLTKTKSKVDGTKPPIPLLRSASKRLSGSFRSKDDQGKKPEEAITAAPSMKKTSTAVAPTSSIKKTSTFTDEKPETSTMPAPERQPTVTERLTQADEWERAELQDIRQRYNKLREMIDSWENKKKMKARRKLDKDERGLAEKRMKSLEDFQNRITSIDQIANGARTKAAESRKNEEEKAKEKANVIRTTGKMPGICSCF
ncbi:hypothetical protein VNO78_09314 [Psophocarpus tetragonolobus]|uniref:Remorin C-terminal domain-containing protein n=1 Tax=Psophocarpus tetragonolobus TaxID=3891 RepID=A0AAN9SW76_PSOTE